MACRNVLRSSLQDGRFVFNVEFTAPDLSESADDVVRLAELAAADDRVAAVTITDRVPSVTTHDPIDLGIRAAEVSGKMPLVHLSGKNRSAMNMRRQCERMVEAGLADVLIVTGDVPRVDLPDPMDAAPDGILDSVQGIAIARQVEPQTDPGAERFFYIAAAVTSFKYTEPLQMMQYLKMEKKARVGADVFSNQVGYDLRKAEELPKYARHRGLRAPLIASMYWLTPGFAKFARRGEVAGVEISEDLAARLGELAKQPDKGKRARQELMALHVLLAESFGYRGVHVGGFKDPGSVRAILDLRDEIAARGRDPEAWLARWNEILRLGDGRPCETGAADGYHFFERAPNGLNTDTPRPDTESRRPSPIFRFMRILHDLLFTRAMEEGGIANRAARLLDRTRPTARLTYYLERASKYPLLGCEGCGSCSLPETQYVCIQASCGKQLPNGPCGGSTLEGKCEVRSEDECAWIEIYCRAKAVGELDDYVAMFVPAKDPALEGTSSWINMATGRDHRGSPNRATSAGPG